ncbi:hypothetical protein BJ741DRAFT_615773 [Chytriomyces cf. hyalinus JEL632]|nr:hypothetical protein BJ741DRAFT_615773 [Chytriomyces cf. hyalinus JEL632]
MPVEPNANPSKKLTLRNGIFEKWELEEKALAAAISSAERTHSVRHQIYKGTKSDPLLSTSKFGRYANVLGLIGYERLQIKQLGRVDQIGERRLNVGSGMPGSLVQRDNKTKKSQSIPALLKKIVGEIESVSWLAPDEREALINAFISDLAHRFNHTHDLISTQYSAAQNRRIILRLFEKIGDIKTHILEKCRVRKASMDLLGIFAEDANSTRVISNFRTELSRRINTNEIIQSILLELEGKDTVVEAAVVDNHDLFKQQIQEFKDAMDSVIHAIPILEPPKISAKGHQTSVRQKLIQENANQAKQETFNFANRFMRDTVTFKNAPWASGKREAMRLMSDMEAIIALNQSQFQSGSLEVQTDINSQEIVEDPLLQAHTSSTKLARRHRAGFSIPLEVVKRERYLPATSHRQNHYFDYSILDDKKTLENRFEPVFVKQQMPDKSISRTMESRVSTRVPKGFINLSAEPASAVSEFGSEVDTRKIDILDEKLSRYKEIEELYEEIMRSMFSNHLETDEDATELSGCPPAPFDPKIPLSNAFKGVVMTTFSKPWSRMTKVETAPENEKSDGENNAVFTPQIRLTTRKYAADRVPADDFIKDRQNAMKRIVSSKYNTFKYNFGGYTPYKEKKKVKKVETFNHGDYLDYIRTRTCDFVLDLLIDSEEEARAFQKAMEEEANRKADAERIRKLQQEEEDRKERRRRRTLYSRGKWNVGALTYMREVQQLTSDDEKSVDLTSEDSDVEKEEKDFVDSSTAAEAPESMLNEAEVQLAKVERVMAKKPNWVRTKSDTDITSAQQELEQLWVTLKMPLDQKLDMAIKYGSHKFGPKLDLAIKYWKIASGHITAREGVISEIIEYEKEASNPDRYFRKGYDGSSEARMLEAKIRDGHLAKLHGMETQLADIISMIKYELNETVTYQGIPYTEKMKSDYHDILQKYQKQRPFTPNNHVRDQQ